MMALHAALARGLRNAVERVAGQAVDAREAALESLTAETRTLTQFSAEIAHELKNPLATVKGLAVLLASSAQGKDVERVAVLRRDVDRMHAVLESTTKVPKYDAAARVFDA